MEGKPGREGSPISAASEGRRPFPAPPRPWVRCSPVAGMLPKGARAVCGHPPLRCTHPCAGQHAHPPGGDPPVCDTPTRVGTRVRRGGCNTRVRARTGRHTQRSRTHPCPQTDTDTRFAPVVCKRSPAGCTPAAPGLREPWGIPYPGYPFPCIFPPQTGRLCRSFSPLHPTHSIKGGGGSGAARGCG